MRQSERGHRASSLETDAAELRRQLAMESEALGSSGFPLWKKTVLFLLFTGTILGAVLLLIFQDSRQQMVAKVEAAWIQTYTDQDPEVFPLPPPPPKSAETRVRIGDPGYASEQDDFNGVLYSSSSPWVGEETEEAGADYVPPVKTNESQRAYDFLTSHLPVAQKLAEHALEGYELKEWKPAKDASPVFFIDLIVTRNSDGQELHLVWEVDLSKETVRALSQAARDLVR